jgi:hypothetical protein
MSMGTQVRFGQKFKDFDNNHDLQKTNEVTSLTGGFVRAQRERTQHGDVPTGFQIPNGTV